MLGYGCKLSTIYFTSHCCCAIKYVVAVAKQTSQKDDEKKYIESSLANDRNLQLIHISSLLSNHLLSQEHRPSSLVEKLHELHFAKPFLIKAPIFVDLLQFRRHVIRPVTIKQ